MGCYDDYFDIVRKLKGSPEAALFDEYINKYDRLQEEVVDLRGDVIALRQIIRTLREVE